ncbi:unnamed protein product [Kuraishia capsulata CBS 1993]|uniref:J domain-containing protein n=1 Tax=Kuraishia capsulata CBS 1993 TaxID=1382522 RepID=W6MKJ5_9ASCO|nr:uncharacterized protein KUCA_T00001209001 [Kuraishia capsulata CBS 1993]CDK25242.1 unnamed protein product [Kuraishia capsulata CBS 1993]
MAKEYTKEQEDIVKTILSIERTDYYKILQCDKKSTETELKKSYRKLAIKCHPDKNKHPQSAEAFKKLAKAFEVLGDDTKKKIYDQTGSDPDARGGMGGGGGGAGFNPNTAFGGGSPFGAGSPFGGGRPFGGQGMFDDDILNFVFGNGGPFGGSPFGGTPVYTFNFGGGGPRFAQAGDPRMRRRPAQGARGGPGATNRGNGGAPPLDQNLLSQLVQMAPLLLVVVVPFLLNLFSGESSTRLPNFSFEAQPSLNVQRSTPKHNVPYYIAEKDLKSYNGNDKKLNKLDSMIENYYVKDLRTRCSREDAHRNRLIEDSYGFFFTDKKQLEFARNLELPSCSRLQEMNLL